MIAQLLLKWLPAEVVAWAFATERKRVMRKATTVGKKGNKDR